MNVANALTMSRIVLTFVFMFFLFSHGLLPKVLALIVFVVASLTDMLDGLVAKSTHSVTDFGKLMDPIADKVLTLAAFLGFVQMEIVPAWMVVIIMLREFSITGLRLLALNEGRVIPASEGGKHKTVSQFVAICAILIFLVIKEAGAKTRAIWNPQMEHVGKEVIYSLLLITVVLTTVSGVSYLVKNKEIWLNEKSG